MKSIKPGDKKTWSLTKKMKNKTNNSVDLLKVGDHYMQLNLKKNLLTINYRHAVDNQVSKSVNSIDKIRPSVSEYHVETKFVQKIIKKLKVKKATGLDGIPNILIKRLPPIAVEFLTKMINACYFPNKFKITPILKLKKNSKCAVNYRPISLLSSI